jgi:hypothetical protein
LEDPLFSSSIIANLAMHSAKETRSKL